ncbi:MAG: S26 family signal peptidase [Firmicutes bacterium HGW-Firmicutes-7]|nr:MAG: S26 family signal peptidase [Firmicutes bacterium HGW-Firmicutes-7]
MIYKNSYFKKELRQIYTENKIASNRKIAFALFMGLISFAIYFLLQTLQNSVIADVVPEIMQPSFFSTLYIYIHLSFFLNTIYFIVYYDYLFFSEIRKNSWYLLVQMGYNPVTMIFSKFFALLYSVILTYTVGFAFVILLTFFLKYNFILAYIPSLYFAGLTDLIFISTLAMTISLYVKTILNAWYLTFFFEVAIIALKIMSKYYTVLSNRVIMQNIYNLYNISRSWFMPAAGIIIIASGLVCMIRAKNVAKYYNLHVNNITSLNAKVVYIDSKKGRWRSVYGNEEIKGHSKIIHTVISVGIIIIICCALLINIFIIIINASTPGNEVAIRGVIPFIFRSDTMEPSIMLNDLVYFQKIDNLFEVEVGEIILFKENNIVYAERVIEREKDIFAVDIDNYPPMSQPGAMLKTVQRENIIGIFSGRNRWLGALILFSNTIFGRLLFLLVPTVLLFYYKQIIGLYQRNNKY